MEIRLATLSEFEDVKTFYNNLIDQMAGMGFQYRETIKLFYEDTGLTDFLLYEYVL